MNLKTLDVTVLVAAIVASCSVARGQDIASFPRSTENAPAAAPADWLNPKFRLGQRAVIQFTKRESRTGNVLAGALVDLEVVSIEGKDIVLRWYQRPPVTPSSLTDVERVEYDRKAKEIQQAPIEFILREGEGMVGLKDWKAVADDWIRVGEAGLKQRSPSIDQAKVDKVMANMKAAMSSKAYVEQIVLQTMTPLFQGAWLGMKPNEERREKVEMPSPFGGSGAVLEATRTFKCDDIDAKRPELAKVKITIESTPEGIRRAIRDVAKQNGEKDEVLRAIDTWRVESSTACEWTLDRSHGWPIWASVVTTMVKENEETRAERTWKLIEGPTDAATGTAK